jgi:hypothetical protein
MEVNREGVSWLEAAPHPRRPGLVEVWDLRRRHYESAGLHPPRFVTHHALIEEYDIDPDVPMRQANSRNYVQSETGHTILADTGTQSRWRVAQHPDTWADVPAEPSWDTLGPSYSQAYADRHQMPSGQS